MKAKADSQTQQQNVEKKPIATFRIRNAANLSQHMLNDIASWLEGLKEDVLFRSRELSKTYTANFYTIHSVFSTVEREKTGKRRREK